MDRLEKWRASWDGEGGAGEVDYEGEGDVR